MSFKSFQDDSHKARQAVPAAIAAASTILKADIALLSQSSLSDNDKSDLMLYVATQFGDYLIALRRWSIQPQHYEKPSAFASLASALIADVLAENEGKTPAKQAAGE